MTICTKKISVSFSGDSSEGYYTMTVLHFYKTNYTDAISLLRSVRILIKVVSKRESSMSQNSIAIISFFAFTLRSNNFYLTTLSSPLFVRIRPKNNFVLQVKRSDLKANPLIVSIQSFITNGKCLKVQCSKCSYTFN